MFPGILTNGLIIWRGLIINHNPVNWNFYAIPVQLMEEVARMTYTELFHLKKSLLETGQTVLAKTVPVKTEPPLEESTDELYQDLSGKTEISGWSFLAQYVCNL